MPKSVAPKPFKWTLFAHRAAAVLAFGGSSEEAAEVADRKSKRTVEIWLKHPEFKAVVDELRAEFASKIVASIEGESLANFETRIREMDALYIGLKTIVKERAVVAPENVPGGKTGLLRTIVVETVQGRGEDAMVRTHTEHVLDKDLTKQMESVATTVDQMVNKATAGAKEDGDGGWTLVAD